MFKARLSPAVVAGFLVSIVWVCYTTIMDAQAYRNVELAVNELTDDEKLTPEKLTYVVGILKATLIMCTSAKDLDREPREGDREPLLDFKKVARKFLP